MCHIPSIRLFVMVLSWMKAIFAIYIFGIGCYFASSTPIQQAYGTSFLGYGFGFIILSMMSGFVVVPHYYAVKKHNRFLLVLCFLIDMLCFILLITTGNTVRLYTLPLFTKSFQMDCLLNQPVDHTQADCLPFFRSDRTAGFRLFWEGYYTKKSNVLNYQILSTIEGDICCGFFAPMKCVVDSQSFPTKFSQTGISKSFLSQRVECGNMPGYYPQQDICLVYYDQAAVPPIVGGCNYDLGLSYCLNQVVQSSSMGCASTVEDYVAALVGPHSIVIIVLSAFNFLSMLFSCCMWWKRRETDIFPEFEDETAVSVF